MQFISTKGMTNETAPEGPVLVQYLEPFFGGWTVEFAIGFYDNPNDYYEDKDEGEGWLDWEKSEPINVIAYALLPEKMKSKYEKMNQIQFRVQFGTLHPNMGCVGE